MTVESGGAPRPASRLLNIVNTRGLHARASAKFVQLAEQFDADIRVSREGHTVPGTSIMGLMMLAAAPGCCILIEAEGADAEAALVALEALVADGFGERD
ncbi:MAG: HPr family phosphocarrier protein [Parvibaculum sp.]|nr:HPr family phosphocarrier protein [Parvibaculum sp.]